MLAAAIVVSTNASPVSAAASKAYEDFATSRPAYQQKMGRWDTFNFPDGMKINAIHAAMLPTGKLLIIAGSGNDAAHFAAGTFSSMVWDPETGKAEVIPTPKDMFCSGHAFLSNGDLLVAGGTRAYEVLPGDVKAAAGAVMIKNENPHTSLHFPKGTVLTGTSGLRYKTTFDVHVPPATKVDRGGGDVTVTASQTKVWAQSVDKGKAGVAPAQNYQVEGVSAEEARNTYGVGDPMTMDKEDFQGLNISYVFDPYTERYRKTGSMNESRWYPTLVGMDGGMVMAVSGLDETGKILEGQNETYDPATGIWTERPGLKRYFPTYPSLFRLTGDRLFYSGSNAGYGPDDKGRTPGVWDLSNNSFQNVDGLSDPTITETSSSILLPPAQDQKVMIMGGGGIGESSKVTARTAVADLTAATPVYKQGPNLLHAVRYPSAVTLPDDSVLITGGSSDYRGKHDSDVLDAAIYHPADDTLTKAASPHVGRNYHSEALLLPDGRVITLGSNPLYGDAKDTQPGDFEQRVEIYTPAYLFHGARPKVTDAPSKITRGSSMTVTTSGPSTQRLRLVRPSAVTHVTDTEQRSVAVDITARGAEGSLTATIPSDEGVLPSGWYMLFAVDGAGTPSVAKWVHVA